MLKYILLALGGLAVFLSVAGTAPAAETTLRLRGSDLTFTGKLNGFDGKTFELATERFGSMLLSTERYDCIAGSCDVTKVNPAAAVAPRANGIGSAAPAPTLNQNALPTDDRNTRQFEEFLKWRKDQARKQQIRKNSTRKKSARIKAKRQTRVRDTPRPPAPKDIKPETPANAKAKPRKQTLWGLVFGE